MPYDSGVWTFLIVLAVVAVCALFQLKPRASEKVRSLNVISDETFQEYSKAEDKRLAAAE